MNSLLAESLAAIRRREEAVAWTDVNSEGHLAINGLVSRIMDFELGATSDGLGIRRAWFDCVDQEAYMDVLKVPATETASLRQRDVRLLVKEVEKEGEGALSGNVYAISKDPSHDSRLYLFGFLAVHDTNSKLFLGDSRSLVLPGSEAFRDIEATVDFFLPD